MKPLIKTALTTIKRWFAWHQMRAVETALNDAYTLLDYITDADAYCAAQANIRLLSKELCRTRAHYQSFLPNGQRIVWDIA